MIAKAQIDDVALVDAGTSAGIGDMSVSWWHAEVAAGRAPAPVVRRTRCTRWLLRDVLDFWRAFAAQEDEARSARVAEQAKRASEAARVKRNEAKRRAEVAA